jgi:hypothetical protein
MNQQEFYQLPEVLEQIEIQKFNAYRSPAHRQAFDNIGLIADKNGVGDQYRKAGGGIYD